MRTMEVEKSCDGSSSSRNLRVSMETMRMVVGGFKCWRRRAKSVDWCINFLCASVCVCLLSGLDGERAGRSAFQSALSLSLSLSPPKLFLGLPSGRNQELSKTFYVTRHRKCRCNIFEPSLRKAVPNAQSHIYTFARLDCALRCN